MSTYTTNIPQAAQKIKNTTSLIRANFDNLAAGLSNDHADLNDPTSGKRLTHDKVRLNVQGAAPTTTTTQIALYSKNVLTSAVNYPELFLRRESNGTEIQLSAGGLTPALSGDALNTQGYTFLPGGLVFVWGNKPFTNDADNNIEVNGINAKKIYSIQCQVVATPPYIPTALKAFVVLIQNINNGVNPATFKPRYLKENGDDAFAVPVFYQAIVELPS